MKISLIIFAVLISSFTSYWLGYQQGTFDWAVVESTLKGETTTNTLKLCAKKSSSKDCDTAFMKSDFRIAVSAQVNNHHKMSYIAPYALIGYDRYLESIDRLREQIEQSGNSVVCDYLKNLKALDKSYYDDCTEDVALFIGSNERITDIE